MAWSARATRSEVPSQGSPGPRERVVDAFWAWLWGTGWFWFAALWVALFVNGRASSFARLEGHAHNTCRFVERRTRPHTLPTKPRSRRTRPRRLRALVPGVAGARYRATLRRAARFALSARQASHRGGYAPAESVAPPTMGASTAEIVRRFARLPPGSRRCSRSSRCRAGEKGHQLTGPSGPRCSSPCSISGTIPRRVWIG